MNPVKISRVDKTGHWPNPLPGEQRLQESAPRVTPQRIIEKPWTQTPADYWATTDRAHSPDPTNYPKGKKAKGKIKKTMGEWKAGTLHSGSKTGPEVKSQKQAVAIALSQAREAAKG